MERNNWKLPVNGCWRSHLRRLSAQLQRCRRTVMSKIKPMRNLTLAANTVLPAAQPTGRKEAAAMLDNTIERLHSMKMSAFADELERQLEDKESFL